MKIMFREAAPTSHSVPYSDNWGGTLDQTVGSRGELHSCGYGLRAKLLLSAIALWQQPSSCGRLRGSEVSHVIVCLGRQWSKARYAPGLQTFRLQKQ